MIVSKFGGSSVASSTQIKKVKDILFSNEERKVVVVSAPGKRNKEDQKVTDLLYKCNSLVQEGKSCKSVFSIIANRFLEIAKELGVDDKELNQTLESVRISIDAGFGESYAASRGEYLSAYLISKYLGWNFIDASDVIVINSDGTVNEETYQKIEKRMDKNKNYVFPGFYGKNERGEVKTFSRGGSDITGSILSRALGADLYENWTDVSGVFAVNPNLVQDAKVIEKISYRQIREFSEVGASVFHEEAIAPVVDEKIPINVKNTNSPLDEGTIISTENGKKGIFAISGKSGYSRIVIHKLMLFKKSGIRHALLTMLHVFGVNPKFSSFGLDSIVWYFDTKSLSKNLIDEMCTRLKKEFSLDEVYVEEGFSVIGLIGTSLMESDDYIDALCALKRNRIKVKALNFGSSDTSILLFLTEEKTDDAIKIIYSEVIRKDK